MNLILKIFYSLCIVILWVGVAHSELYFSDFFGIKISDSRAKNMRFPEDLGKTNMKYADWEGSLPYEWTGSIKVEVGISGDVNEANCSGTVAALENYQPEDKVLFLTAGHCLLSPLGLTDPKFALTDLPLPKENKLSLIHI